MTTKPIQLNSTELGSFITLQKACVVQATIGTTTEFNSTLLTSLRGYFKLPFTIGSIDFKQLDYEDHFIKKLIGEQMEDIGLMASDTLLPGYYLFKNGILVAYHPGTFDVSRLNPDMVNTTMKIAAGVSIFTALFLKDVTSGLQMFAKFSEVPTGMSIFEFFKEVLEVRSEVDILKKQQFIFKTEIERAYNLLGITSSATDTEVKSAYKKKLSECHPDKNRGKEDTSTKLTVKVIEAYELIIAERKTNKVEI